MFWRRHAVHEDDLSAYVDGQLDAAARERIGTHVAACSACQATVADLRELRSAMRAMPRATAPRSFALRAADVERTTPDPAGPFARAMPMLGGLTAVAALTFFVLLGFDAQGSVEEQNDAFGGTQSPLMEAASLDDGDAAPEPMSRDAEARATAAPADNFADLEENPADGSGDEPALSDDVETTGEAPAPGEAAADEVAEDEPVADEPASPDTVEMTGERATEGAPADDGAAPNEFLPATQAPDDGDGWAAIRVAEAAAAGVALAAAASFAFVWWRRRA